MKKPSNALTILLLYLATVPTNVIALGAFTESWIRDFQLSRQTLSLFYLLSTFIVFLLLVGIKIRYSLKTTLLALSLCCQMLVFIPSTPILMVALIVIQWLGQGWMVEACRALLLQTSSKTMYGIWVGFMEATGTIGVFLCPFIFLFFMKNFTWKVVFLGLSIIYFIISISISSYSRINYQVPFFKLCDRKFLLANILIYLPVFLASGFFFHLEACCQTFRIPISILESCTWQQGIGIVLLQIILSRFLKCTHKIVYTFLTLLLISQIVWIFNLFNFNSITYLLSTILGWSIFGLLVNVLWQFFYPQNLVLNEQKLKASVAFGFLANAIGPIVFYIFI